MYCLTTKQGYRVSVSKNKHRGSTLDSFLEEEGILEDMGKHFVERWQDLEAGGAVAVAKLTTCGGVTIPKAICEKHGWSAGTKLKLSEEDGIVLLVEAGRQDD